MKHIAKVKKMMQVGSEIGSNLIKASIRQYDDEVKETEKEIKGNIKAI